MLVQSNESWFISFENFLFEGNSFSLASESSSSFSLLPGLGDPIINHEVSDMAVLYVLSTQQHKRQYITQLLLKKIQL